MYGKICLRLNILIELVLGLNEPTDSALYLNTSIEKQDEVVRHDKKDSREYVAEQTSWMSSGTVMEYFELWLYVGTFCKLINPRELLLINRFFRLIRNQYFVLRC